MNEKTEKSLRSLITGIIHMDKSEFKKANFCFEKSILQNDDNEIAWFAKALTYQKMGKTDEAQGCLKVVMMSFEDMNQNSNCNDHVDVFSTHTIKRETPKLDFMI
jgi:tetratricopeptide (TPR) repeat protein